MGMLPLHSWIKAESQTTAADSDCMSSLSWIWAEQEKKGAVSGMPGSLFWSHQSDELCNLFPQATVSGNLGEVEITFSFMGN